MRYFPFLLFLLIALGLGVALKQPHDITPTSPLVGKTVPVFSLPSIGNDAAFSSDALKGEVALLNFFASWCIACEAEHATLTQLGRSAHLPVYGIAWKDKPDKVRAWLSEHGNPYAQSGIDADGKAALAFGIYGVPETYVIDRHGVIRYRLAGPLMEDNFQQEILPLVKRLRDE